LAGGEVVATREVHFKLLPRWLGGGSQRLDQMGVSFELLKNFYCSVSSLVQGLRVGGDDKLLAVGDCGLRNSSFTRFYQRGLVCMMSLGLRLLKFFLVFERDLEVYDGASDGAVRESLAGVNHRGLIAAI
jgi:hypothetical protein